MENPTNNRSHGVIPHTKRVFQAKIGMRATTEVYLFLVNIIFGLTGVLDPKNLSEE